MTTADTRYRTLHFDTRIYVGNVPLDVAVLDTPEERELGLMRVKDLPTGKGALFVFEREKMVDFWMKSVSFPVDMLFFDKQGKVLYSLENVKPCHSNKCPSVSVSGVKYVLELAAGSDNLLNLWINPSPLYVDLTQL